MIMNIHQTARKTHFQIPRYAVIAYLTIFSIGVQYFINLTYLFSQIPVQDAFTYGNYAVIIPTVLSYLAFATFLVIGPAVAKRYGLRNMYLFFVMVLLAGTLAASLAPSSGWFVMGRWLQGAGAGALYMVMVPLVAVLIPTRHRNWFIFIILSGLFGATGLGGVFGGLSLTMDAWRWLFALGALLLLSCLALGYLVLPKTKPSSATPADRWGIALLFFVGVTLVFPLMNIQKWGLYSLRVWPFFALAIGLLLFFIGWESMVQNPILPFHLLAAPKPFFGTVMAAAANVAVTCSVVGISGYLLNVEQVHFATLAVFFLGFFAGTVASGFFSAWLYDKLGAGILGTFAALGILYVSFNWNHMNSGAPIMTLAWQFGILGLSFGIVLVTGSLGGTLAASDISELASLSMGMQYIRNLFSAFGSPILGWAVLKYTTVHYEQMQSRAVVGSPYALASLQSWTNTFSQRVNAQAANAMAHSLFVNQVQASSQLFAYQRLFTILFILGLIMLAGSIGMAVTGKGLSIAQEEDPLVGLFPMG